MTADVHDVRVLILEDDYFLATDAQRELEQAGARVIGPCGTAEEAMAALERDKPDCALVDVNLGHGPDFDPARAFINHNVPVILVTGYDADVIPSELRGLRRLTKPTDPRRLVAAVGEAAGR